MSPAIDLAQRFTNELLSFFEQQRAEIEPEAQPLLDELEALVTSGGKRLRPRFAYWGHLAARGVDDEPIMRIGAALEVLHTMALIHDDVMDRSHERRNRTSTFRALAELSAGVEHRGDPARFGASAAILTGLLGFVLADRLFLGAGFSPASVARALDRYDRMRVRAIAGQYLDLLAAHRGEADVMTALRIASLKSGSYSVADPLCIGALLADGTDEMVDALERYGEPLGTAFQLRDDVLGTFGDRSQTGKDRDGDLREAKQTVLLAMARDRANARQRRILAAHVGDPELSSRDADRVRDVITETGALADTEALVAELAHDARNALVSDALDEKAVDALVALSDEATVRTS